MKTHRDTFSWLWLALVLFVALSIAYLGAVTPQDYWWYLRVGRDTLAAGSVPRVDTLTFTQAGTAVDYQSWGAAVIFYLVYRLGGLTLTVLLRGLLVGVTYWLVWWTARQAGAGRLSAAVVLLIAVLTSSNNWAMRPQLFAYPLFALALFILYRWHQGEKKGLWALPLLSLLWVNLHGSFVMLILLAGAALVFGRGDRRSLAYAFGGILLATLINPRGFGTWSYVYHSLTVASNRFSVEWLPPVNTGWQMNLFFLWLLAFPLLAAFSEEKLDRLEWIWFLGFGLLALWGVRYVIWFVLVLVVLTARLLSGWEKRWVRISPAVNLAPVNLGLAALLVLLPLALLPGVRTAWWKNSPAPTQATPVAAVEWLAARPDLPGPLWSEIGFSSYLEFALPQRPTWIDTRFEVFPVDQWQAYKTISAGRYDWDQRLADAGINLLLVSAQKQPDLLLALQSARDWCLVYQDPVAAIYARGSCELVK